MFLRVTTAIGTNTSPFALCNANNLPRAPVGVLGKLFLRMKEIMPFLNELKKVKAILARIVEAHKMGDCDAIKKSLLQKTWRRLRLCCILLLLHKLVLP